MRRLHFKGKIAMKAIIKAINATNKDANAVRIEAVLIIL